MPFTFTFASGKGDLETMRRLLDAKVDVNGVTSKDSRHTALRSEERRVGEEVCALPCYAIHVRVRVGQGRSGDDAPAARCEGGREWRDEQGQPAYRAEIGRASCRER